MAIAGRPPASPWDQASSAGVGLAGPDGRSPCDRAGGHAAACSEKCTPCGIVNGRRRAAQTAGRTVIPLTANQFGRWWDAGAGAVSRLQRDAQPARLEVRTITPRHRARSSGQPPRSPSRRNTMKKLGLLVSVLAVTTLAAPAQAATSKTTSKAPKIVKTTDTFACANGKRATFHHEGYRAGPKASDSWDSWWVTTRETVTNRCGS